MKSNDEILFGQIREYILGKYGEILLTEEQICAEAGVMRQIFLGICSVSDVEYENIKKKLVENLVQNIGFADTLRSRDEGHQVGWYRNREVGVEEENFFWNRYQEYLRKTWSPEVVNRLHQTTDNIMDDLGDPKSDKAFQRRGLLLGDVQSGKTATYTAIANKAADAGYKVVIVLAGMMENLRIQTQERLDKEFVGLDSKHIFDNKADSDMRNEKVGVGRVRDSNDKRISRFTSVTNDFKIDVLRQYGLNLKDLKSPALFVVKKNKSVLNNLYKWLTKDEAMLDLPLLLIDDEADNASINTNSDEFDPTAINRAINQILRAFKQATYLGITATPFANIFIDPNMDDDGAAKDLFPRHFLTLLPSPDHYIGAEKIFGSGTTEDGEEITSRGRYESVLVPIKNEEQEHYFRFKHRQYLAESMNGLPYSLKEAICYFMIATAISDFRFDNDEHRSMLINVSRFTLVQNKIRDLVEEYVNQMKSDIENYHALSTEQIEKIESLSFLHKVWKKYHLKKIINIEWYDFLRTYLYKATRRIVVRAVNQSTGAKTLDYYNYKDMGMRVIAIGGNSLSRGLTLEGLIVSYFYRNTMMYDTLLQMGRWFGYRRNYEDLFKLWIAEDAIGWYSYITEAFSELKDELRKMARQNLTPEEFGLKVRQDPGGLIVTARNKMRRGEIVKVPVTVSGRMLETPRLKSDPDIIEENNIVCEEFVKNIDGLKGVKFEFDDKVDAYIWRDVPKNVIIDFILNYKSHPWNLNFQAPGLAEFIDDEPTLSYWDVAIPVPRKSEEAIYNLELNDGRKIALRAERRKVSMDVTFKQMLKVGDRHVRIGAGGCTKIGLDQDQIESLKEKARGTVTDKTYLIENRKPLALVHRISNTNVNLKGYPQYIYAIGLGFPGGKKEKIAYYVINSTELDNYVNDEVTNDGDEDI